MRHHRPMLQDVPVVRGTAAGMVSVTRLSTPPRTPPPPDFLASYMASDLKLRKQLSAKPSETARLLSPGTIRPLVGRDAQGRLRLFTPERMDMISNKPGPGGWTRVASFDGLASSQRGVPPRTLRFGPGPEQSMPHMEHSLSSSGYSLSQRFNGTVV